MDRGDTSPIVAATRRVSGYAAVARCRDISDTRCCYMRGMERVEEHTLRANTRYIGALR